MQNIFIFVISIVVLFTLGTLVEVLFKKTIGKIPEFYLFVTVVFILLGIYSFFSNSLTSAHVFMAGAVASSLYEMYTRKRKTSRK